MVFLDTRRFKNRHTEAGVCRSATVEPTGTTPLTVGRERKGIRAGPGAYFPTNGIAPGACYDSMDHVAQKMVSKEREDAIVRLLDDDSPVVKTAILEELKRLGGIGIAILNKLARGRNRILACQARDYLRELEGPDTVVEFVEFIRSLNYELETGCILLNRTVYPEVEAVDCCMVLDAIAARCRELMILPSAPWEKCKVINRVLFHEYGFRGDAENLSDPRNSYLDYVLKRRKGNPATLCIIYILIAQRCDIQLEPIGMPVRFMVGCFLDEVPFYIDAYERGAFRSEDDLRETLRANKVSASENSLAQSPVGEVLQRCCRNLIRQYQSVGDCENAKLFARFVRQFDVSYQRHVNP